MDALQAPPATPPPACNRTFSPLLEPLLEPSSFAWSLPAGPQFNPSMPLPMSDAAATDIERGLVKAHVTIVALERSLALLNACSAAGSGAAAETEKARYAAALDEAQQRLSEAQQAGDDAVRQQAEVGCCFYHPLPACARSCVASALVWVGACWRAPGSRFGEAACSAGCLAERSPAAASGLLPSPTHLAAPLLPQCHPAQVAVADCQQMFDFQCANADALKVNVARAQEQLDRGKRALQGRGARVLLMCRPPVRMQGRSSGREGILVPAALQARRGASGSHTAIGQMS